MERLRHGPCRRSVRLKGFDYSRAGAYFVTVVCKDRACLLGIVDAGDLRLNAAGRQVREVWQHLAGRFPSVVMDACVIMPNHVHGIVVLAPQVERAVGAGLALLAAGAASSAPTLSDVVRAFKSVSAIAANRALGRSGQPLWQRSYYDRVIRDEEELQRYRQYVAENPLKWALDRENPTRIVAG